MELYLDGVLDTFKAFSGTLQSSTKPLTIGRMDNIETLYALRGSVDEVKIWDKEIPIKQIEQLKDQWATEAGIEEEAISARIYPNPTNDMINVDFRNSSPVDRIALFSPDGRELQDYKTSTNGSEITIEFAGALAGIYFLKIFLLNEQVITSKVVIR
jgi:hypothetical protein